GPAMGFGGMGEGGFGDIFDMFFGAGGGGGRASGERARQQATQGSDLRYDLEITLEEAASGIPKTLRLSRLEACETCHGNGAKAGTTPQTCPACAGAGQVRHVQNTILGSFATVAPCARCGGAGRIITDPCPTCRGQGRLRRTAEHTVDIPAGVDSGTRLVDPGQGDAGLRGGGRGDLYVIIYVQPHAQFTRRGMDVLHEAPVTFAQATLGDTFEVPILGGTERLTIPEGTQPGTAFRLRGKGFPDVNARSPERGDQIVSIKMKVPTKLTEEQRRLVKELAAASGETLHLDERGLFGKVKDVFSHK
ncbi:MAG: J domain-containing protein, partial [Armatimonadota bacterium]|nr:J domain-containing protein [Armatimonadota bacterium]